MRSLRGYIVISFVTLVVVFAAVAGAAMTAVWARDGARTALNERLRPAQLAVASLTQSLLDQENGVRGFELTGEASFLDPYTTGISSQHALLGRLRTDLTGSPHGLAAMRSVAAAVDAWRAQAAETGIADRRARATAQAVPLSNQETGRRLFETVQSRLALLTRIVSSEIASQSATGAAAGDRLEWIVAITLGLLFALSLALYALLRRQVTKPLAILGRSIATAGSGNLEEPIPVVGASELATLAGSVERMRCRLLDQAGETLNRSVVLAQHDERRRIAQDIHDDSVQSLTALLLRLQRLEARLADPEHREVVQDAQTAASDAIERLRRLMFELHPAGLERDGLAPALRAYLADTLDPGGLRWQVDGTLGHELSGPVQALAYRLTREAVLNAIKHAAPTRLRVSITGRNGGVGAVVTDDGAGFDPHDAPQEAGHLGLSAAAEAAAAAGGWWRVHSRPAAGTTVEFWLPDAGTPSLDAMTII